MWTAIAIIFCTCAGLWAGFCIGVRAHQAVMVDQIEDLRLTLKGALGEDES